MNGWIINATPQIVNTSAALTDTSNWMQISGTFTASGNEEYITIGNFMDDANCGIQNVNGGAYNRAYYYVDDVSLSPCTGLNNAPSPGEISIYPNPFTEKINVETIQNETLEIIIYDITSRKLVEQRFIKAVSLNGAQLKNGIYIYEVRNKNSVIRKGKITKN